MTTHAATSLPTSSAGLNVGDGAQTGDLRLGDVTGGDKTIHGVPAEQVISLLARHLDKEPQYREAQAKAIERSHASTTEQLGQIARILGRLTTALAVEAVVLFLLLLVMIQVLLVLVTPRLIAGI